MNPLIESLLTNKPVLLDGSWGTQLQHRGLPIGGCAESWNLDNPDQVKAVAESYVQAGSDIILTNTFCGNRIMLERHGLGERVAEVNQIGASLSTAAAGETARVFGSIGPTGKMLMMGDISEDELSDMFTEQVAAIQAGGVDGIALETFSDLDEIRIAIRAAKATGLPVAACMVYDAGDEGDHTMMGITPEQAAEATAEEGADIVGANCGTGIQNYVPIAKRLKDSCDLPVWIKPNAGLPKMIDGKAVYTMTPEEFGEWTEKLLNNGADFVGGCCGTSPEFIKAVREVLG